MKITLTDINGQTAYLISSHHMLLSSCSMHRAKNRSEERHHLINILHWNDNNRNPIAIREIQGRGKEQEPA